MSQSLVCIMLLIDKNIAQSYNTIKAIILFSLRNYFCKRAQLQRRKVPLYALISTVSNGMINK